MLEALHRVDRNPHGGGSRVSGTCGPGAFPFPRARFALALALVFSIGCSDEDPERPSTPEPAPEIWTGTDLFFAKADSADWRLPENQDRITDDVWITRANRRGLFNIAQEMSYDHEENVSPVGTEWATGSAADWASLTFDTWYNWADGIPPNTVGVEAVVHLVESDIYLDLRIESWSLGDEGGFGGFSYRRASGPTETQPAAPAHPRH